MKSKRSQRDVSAGKSFSLRSLAIPLLVGLLTGVGVFIGVHTWLTRAPAAPQSDAPAVASGPSARFDALKGRWVRQEGGYVVDVKDVDVTGRIDAAYLNPRPINVAKAQASQTGERVDVFLELRDTGYPGCTYTLTYEPHTDKLLGVYFQAAVGERFPVIFDRAK
jgi:hypothetical protein